MKIKFLGTGAADFLPSLLKKDKSTICPDIRRCSSTLLNGSVLVDCGPHTLDSLNLFGCDISKIKHLIITHTHSDHFDPAVISQIAITCPEPLNIWYNEEINLPTIKGIQPHPIKIGEDCPVGNFNITLLHANHSIGAVHISIDEDGKKLFYGLDGAWLTMETYYAMRDKLYNIMILDATVGDYEGDYRMAEHNSLPMIRLMHKSFLTFNIVSDETKIVLSHMARTLHPAHNIICQNVKNDGYIVAFDGMEITI